MITIKNFIYSFLAGVAGILPGISGSALLVIFNMYDKILLNINNIFKKPYQSIKYLLPIGAGIILGFYLTSHILIEFITKYTLLSSIIFIFFIIATIPNIINNISIKKIPKYKYLFFLLSFFIGTTLLFIKRENIVSLNNDITTFLIMGILLSISTIIPGISTTLLFNLLGVYQLYLNAISNINLRILIPIIISFVITTYLLSKIITRLLNKYPTNTSLCILGFTTSTIPALLFTKITINLELIIGIILGILILYISIKRNKHAY